MFHMRVTLGQNGSCGLVKIEAVGGEVAPGTWELLLCEIQVGALGTGRELQEGNLCTASLFVRLLAKME